MIDTSGEWWIGSEPQDVKNFLEAYAPDGYKVHEFRLARCECGSLSFFLWADDDEGTAKRTCTVCGLSHFICDSEEFWDGSQPEELVCVCGSKSANVGVGFSLYEDGEVRWLYVGVRCTSCGVLGCFAGWKVAYAPSAQLVDQV
ncbi:MAG: hypothetical protein AB7O65_01760 [Candidatus Korobacteraceae bacterium]